MTASLRNAEMWLKEAKLLAKKGSKGHAQALIIFAGEELGKALMCWMTINGVFPYNHWEVDFKNGKSVFRKHELKNATFMGFSLARISPEVIPDNYDQLVIDPWSGESIGVREYLAKLGAFATWARSSWMYVDIKKECSQLEVYSPLAMSPYSVEGALKDMEYSLKTFKRFVRASKEHPEAFRELFKEMRQTLEEKDDKFPKTPQWE